MPTQELFWYNKIPSNKAAKECKCYLFIVHAEQLDSLNFGRAYTTNSKWPGARVEGAVSAQSG